MIETNVMYAGELNPELDNLLDHKASAYNLVRVSSGYGFGIRDLQYSREDKDFPKDHENFVEDLQELAGLSHVSTTITYLDIEVEEDEE